MNTSGVMRSSPCSLRANSSASMPADTMLRTDYCPSEWNHSNHADSRRHFNRCSYRSVRRQCHRCGYGRCGVDQWRTGCVHFQWNRRQLHIHNLHIHGRRGINLGRNNRPTSHCRKRDDSHEQYWHRQHRVAYSPAFERSAQLLCDPEQCGEYFRNSSESERHPCRAKWHHCYNSERRRQHYQTGNHCLRTRELCPASLLGNDLDQPRSGVCSYGLSGSNCNLYRNCIDRHHSVDSQFGHLGRDRLCPRTRRNSDPDACLCNYEHDQYQS